MRIVIVDMKHSLGGWFPEEALADRFPTFAFFLVRARQRLVWAPVVEPSLPRVAGIPLANAVAAPPRLPRLWQRFPGVLLREGICQSLGPVSVVSPRSSCSLRLSSSAGPGGIAGCPVAW